MHQVLKCMDSYHWAAVQLLCRGEQSEVSEDDGLVDSRSITSLFHRSSSMTHSLAHTGTESYFVSCAILADTISSDSSWGYRTMHHSSTIFYDSGRNHDLDEYKCPVWSKYHFVGSISIIFNSALADDYTAGPNSAIIGRTIGADYAIGEEADQRTMRRQMVSRSDHLWSAPRSIGRSVNQLYFSQFTNRICHNLSSVFLAIYELYFSLIPNCISHNLTAICLSFLAPSFDCIANFLHQMFCRREEWQADHLISPSAKSLSVHQLYFLTILKCICQYWPTVFLHMITWLTWSADHSPDQLISPQGAISDCSEMTNIGDSHLFVILPPDRIPLSSVRSSTHSPTHSNVQFLRQLKKLHPSPYIGLVQNNNLHELGALCVRVMVHGYGSNKVFVNFQI